jgi:hypothetical protein
VSRQSCRIMLGKNGKSLVSESEFQLCPEKML